jgi:broad specificity phosphatase PhoE
MPYLYVVRHGQPDFAGNYDSLTGLGEQQSIWLGEHLRARGLRFARAVSGTLQRQVATRDLILQQLDAAPPSSHDAGLNEYDHASLLDFFEGERVQQLRLSGDRRGYFTAIRHALQAWSRHEGPITGGESWAQFGARIDTAIRAACAGLQRDDNVLVVSSGGVIGRLVAAILAAGPDAAVQLNLQVRNTGVTEIVWPDSSPPRLAAFNTIAHLERTDRSHAVTYA